MDTMDVGVVSDDTSKDERRMQVWQSSLYWMGGMEEILIDQMKKAPQPSLLDSPILLGGFLLFRPLNIERENMRNRLPKSNNDLFTRKDGVYLSLSMTP
jgi:hypothetical protein